VGNGRSRLLPTTPCPTGKCGHPRHAARNQTQGRYRPRHRRYLAHEARGDFDRAKQDYSSTLEGVASDAVSKANQATAKVRLSLLSEAEQPRIAPSATLAPTQTVTSSSPLPAAPGAVTQNRENNPMHSSLGGRRVALVIGNGAYVHVKALPNPSNDARSIAKSLRDIGFSVTEGIDLDRGGMQTMIRDFLREAARAHVAMVYFAGHGVQIGGRNSLVPVDAQRSAPAR
jgi:hypothetical protein